ncbi:TPA_asm: ring-cleaving dioxygenase [Listeria monocytogenes]|nr:ring-cleaving dioxygenase [Listeria monocytogenes]
MIKDLKGIHHVTAMTSSAEKNYAFFTEVLGMRLVKKTVNQDDIHTYHLFFADDKGSAGTDMTFFDFPNLPKGRHGTDSISRVAFRVPSDAALEYWLDRFEQLEVPHSDIKTLFGKKYLTFQDFDDQQLQLISDENNEGVAPGTPWKNGPVPEKYAIYGLGPVFLTVVSLKNMDAILQTIFGFRKVTEEDHEELQKWIDRMNTIEAPNSGYVNRFYFESLYVPVSERILFEFATDGPGFASDEPYETLGEKLALPPFLEPKRAEIEKMVRPINTKRS